MACSGDVADARAVAVNMGEDGLLYYAGRSDGGDTLYNCQPFGPDEKIAMVSIDRYNQPYNMHAAGITFIARMHPTQGAVEVGQLQNTKLTSKEASNALETVAIAADSKGYVYLAQQAACCIANRDNLTVGGQKIAPYAGDGVLMVLSPDFRTRVHWTAFSSKPGTVTTARDVSVREKVVAFVATAQGKAGVGMVTVNPLKGTSAPSKDADVAGYLAVLSSP